MRFGTLAWLWLVGMGCGTSATPAATAPATDAPVAGAAEAPAVTPVAGATPALPDDALIQIWQPESGQLYRIAADGRYLVTPPGGAEAQATPKSKDEAGAQVVSAAGLARLDAALTSVDFFSLPVQVPGTIRVAEMMLAASGKTATPSTVVISARRDGKVVTVKVVGDPTVIGSLGTLAPVYAAFDREALGGWTNVPVRTAAPAPAPAPAPVPAPAP